jgi:hypothetical protein
MLGSHGDFAVITSINEERIFSDKCPINRKGHAYEVAPKSNCVIKSNSAIDSIGGFLDSTQFVLCFSGSSIVRTRHVALVGSLPIHWLCCHNLNPWTHMTVINPAITLTLAQRKLEGFQVEIIVLIAKPSMIPCIQSQNGE